MSVLRQKKVLLVLLFLGTQASVRLPTSTSVLGLAGLLGESCQVAAVGRWCGWPAPGPGRLLGSGQH